MNTEERQQNLNRLFMSCNTVEEIHEFARMFNRQYKVMVDHKERMEDLQRGIYKY